MTPTLAGGVADWLPSACTSLLRDAGPPHASLKWGIRRPLLPKSRTFLNLQASTATTMTGDGRGKRKAEGGGGGGKRSKGKYHQHAAKGKPGGIPLNSRGVLVSCTPGKENTAAREAVDLLTQAYERLCPGKTASAAAAPPTESEGTDISALIASEVADLKDASKQTFYWHSIGINALTYVEIKDADAPSPCDLVVEVCRVAKASGQSGSRFVSRLYPVEHACFASMEKIGELAERVVAKHFGEGAPPTQFAVQFDHRASAPLDRMQVINQFAERIKAPHKVNLGSPQKTIIVNLLKNACAVAVAEQFRELAKFNLRTLTTPPEEKDEGGSGGKEGGEAAAAGEAAGGEAGGQQQKEEEDKAGEGQQQQQQQQEGQEGEGAE